MCVAPVGSGAGCSDQLEPFQRSTRTWRCPSVPTATQRRLVGHETEVSSPWRIRARAHVVPFQTCAVRPPTATHRLAVGQDRLCGSPTCDGRCNDHPRPLKRSARFPQRPQGPPVLAIPTAVQWLVDEHESPVSSLSGASPAP